MIDLTTSYMGLALKNPFVVASCSLTSSVDDVYQCAQAGAGAVVLRSLFEEQIDVHTSQLSQQAHEYSGYGEAYDYLRSYGSEIGPQFYLQLVSAAKKAVDIPVIASLNCVTSNSWATYAAKLEQAGADAIELNVSIMPTDSSQRCHPIVEDYLKILYQVKQQVEIPVAMKIGPYFTSFAHVVDRLSHDRAEAPAYSVGWFGKDKQVGKTTWKGVDALVLFNRFYRFDIDIVSQQLKPGNPYSSSAEQSDSLRWISLLSGRAGCDLAASTGIHDGADVIKALLVGAKVVQLCSTLYCNGLGHINTIERQLRQWMSQHDYARLADFRGRLSQAQSLEPLEHERLQYIKLFIDSDNPSMTDSKG